MGSDNHRFMDDKTLLNVGGLLLLAIVVAVWAWSGYSEKQSFMQGTVEVEGRIVYGHTESEGTRFNNRSYIFTMIYFVDGAEFQKDIPVPKSVYHSRKPNENIVLLYHSEHPEDARALVHLQDAKQAWLRALLAAVFLVLALYAYGKWKFKKE